jgi:hypothetical protein
LLEAEVPVQSTENRMANMRRLGQIILVLGVATIAVGVAGARSGEVILGTTIIALAMTVVGNVR